MHYHLLLYSTKFPKTMDKLIKKNFNIALAETTGFQSKYRLEMFSTASVGFKKEFLRNTKTLLTHGPTIEHQLSALSQSNTRSAIDCIWEKCKTLGTEENDKTPINKADMMQRLVDLEKSSSQFKHVVPEIINFLTENNYGTFINTQHNAVLKLSLDVTNAQCNCDECFPSNDTSNIDHTKFQYIDEGTILFEQSID